MEGSNRLSENIRILRMAYGETQNELGKAIGVEKNAIYNYEKGIRELDRYMIAAIAKHYSISAEELVSADLSQLGRIVVDNTVLLKQIKKILPIVSTERAMEDESFRTAHEMHSNIFDKLSHMDMDIAVDDLDCFEKYCDAAENEDIETEAAANIIALWYLLLLFVKRSPELIKDNTAAIVQITKNDPKAKKTLENLSPDFYKDAADMLNETNTLDFKELILECKRILKKSYKWADLGDYYLALQYSWNIVDNELSADFNARVGAEIMKELCSINNKYAIRYTKCCLKAIGK